MSKLVRNAVSGLMGAGKERRKNEEITEKHKAARDNQRLKKAVTQDNLSTAGCVYVAIPSLHSIKLIILSLIFQFCLQYAEIICSIVCPLSSTSSLSSQEGDAHLRHGKRPKAAHYKRRLARTRYTSNELCTNN